MRSNVVLNKGAGEVGVGGIAAQVDWIILVAKRAIALCLSDSISKPLANSAVKRTRETARCAGYSGLEWREVVQGMKSQNRERIQ